MKVEINITNADNAYFVTWHTSQGTVFEKSKSRLIFLTVMSLKMHLNTVDVLP